MRLRKRIGIAAGLLAAVILLFAVYVRAHYVIPILMYHSVDPSAAPGNRLAVTPGTFELQMKFLKEHRYNVVTIGTLAGYIRDKARVPPRTVAVTFDDGYKNVYTHAFPVLKKYGIPATFFIIVGEVGRPQGDRVSWEDIGQMQASGLVEIGSHCLGPEPLINIKDEGTVKREIFESRRILRERLQAPVEVFSYPEGRFTARIRELVIEAGYLAAVATNPGKKFSDRDVFALKRLRISENAKSLFVFWFESSGYYNFFRERRHK